MDFSAALSIFYADFGDDAIVNGNAADPVRGIFETVQKDALGLVTGVHPTFRAAASSPIVRGADVCIKGVHYKAKPGERLDADEILWPLEKV